MTEKTLWKSLIKLAIKLALMAFAFWWISQKISWAETWQILKSSNWFYISIALVFFNASKILSAHRLNRFWLAIELKLDNIKNIKLYYIGMYYNLFLPGGIGGDAYKVWYLSKDNQVSTKNLSIAVIVDRVSGVIPLILLAIILMWVSEAKTHIPHGPVIAISLIFLPAYLISYWLLGKVHKGIQLVFNRSNLDGTGVQLLQLICAVFILLSIKADHQMTLLFLFLVSSVVAVLPLTIGGVGAREWVMVSGSSLMMIDPEPAVALSLIFFAITALSSLSGAFLSIKNSNLTE